MPQSMRLLRPLRQSYRVRWARFDNATGAASGGVDVTTTVARVQAPPEVIAGAAFVRGEHRSGAPRISCVEHPCHRALSTSTRADGLSLG